jgi:hypothetical protein
VTPPDATREGIPIMRLTLEYNGSLPSQQGDGWAETNKRVADKWRIRRQLDPQLRVLWSVAPALIGLGNSPLYAPIDTPMGKYRPLIRRGLALLCKIDVLFLREGNPGNLVSPGGDIDNRMKVLFDGLSMPQPNDNGRDPSETDPIYTLLESDSLIEECSIRTSRLLTLQDDPSHVRLVMDVTVRASMTTIDNIDLLGN